MTNASGLLNQYQTVISTLVDRHAPLTTRSCPVRPPVPWMTTTILEAKRKKRSLERVWRKTRLEFDRKRFQKQIHLYNNLLSTAKSDFFTKIVSENKDNPKKLWSKLNILLHRTKVSILPDCSNIKELADSFGTFFREKIAKLRIVFSSNIFKNSGVINPNYNPPTLRSFSVLNEEEVKKLILSSPSKSCELDPCPTNLVKDCIDILITPITNIINYSIKEGVFPEKFKNALVTPLLKKPTLDRNQYKNYRPVSNLSFLSKLTEKAIASQIKAHINRFRLDNPFQSAYKAYHSTETALLSVQNDIYKAMDSSKVTALTLLDLSAAFDTIDHTILLDRWRGWFGLEGSALGWIASYLKNRYQSINLNGSKSNPVELLFGVPQGSVLGPLLFIMYTTPLSSVLTNSNSISHNLYADDTQVHTSFTSATFHPQIQTLQNTLTSVQDWMFENKLKLNPDKTEFLLIGNSIQRAKVSHHFPISLMGNNISPSPSAKNLGVTFDEDFNFQRHINSTVKACNYHIREFRRIRKHLDMDVATSMANALVSSRLDYCNSLLYGLPNKYIKKLQLVQNTLARIVCNAPKKYTSCTKLLKNLHWLPIRSRIQFKISVLTYKALKFGNPPSLAKHLIIRDVSHNLRSTSAITLMPGPICRGKGNLAFSSSAPKVWNLLPAHVRNATSVNTFRKSLKTHFFTYPP